MTPSKPKTAEANFRAAFERLKAGKPKLLLNAPVSQNNVAREAGCDPSALRKSRFPELVAEIQTYVTSHVGERAPSERQRLIKQRQRSRDAAATNKDLKAQRDFSVSLLVEANAQIRLLDLKVRSLEARLEDLGSTARLLSLQVGKSKATPRAMDIGSDN